MSRSINTLARKAFLGSYFKFEQGNLRNTYINAFRLGWKALKEDVRLGPSKTPVWVRARTSGFNANYRNVHKLYAHVAGWLAGRRAAQRSYPKV